MINNDTGTTDSRKTKTRFVSKISSDKTSAALSIYPADHVPFKITATELKKILKEQGVVYGVKLVVLEELSKALFLSGEEIKDRVVALGVAPVSGQDARMEIVVNTIVKSVGKEKKDGTMDYRRKESIIKVKKGQIIAYYHEETNGLDGIGVDGKPIKTKPGKKLNVRTTNVSFFENESVFRADMDGQLSVKKNNLAVYNVRSIGGDVDFETGCVDFPGTVTISGSVLPDFYVKARGDVFVNGTISDAVVESGGTLKVREGIGGSGKSLITASDDILTGYIQNSNVTSNTSIHIKKVVYSSTVKANNIITVEGMVLGGNIVAGREIIIKDVGTEIGIHTCIEVGVKIMYKEKVEQIEEEINFCNINIEKIERFIGEKICNLPDEFVEQIYKENAPELIRINNVRKKLIAQKEELQLQKQEALQKYVSNEPVCVRIRGAVQPGTKIIVKGKPFILEEEMKYVKFYYDKDEDTVKWASL
ncbi:DUF342 domain-containing protein [bacterium]|nr:DUF342 domain-containing protein [bacterium]